MKRSAEERFWAKVDRRGDRDCWPWLGKLDTDGYGKFRVGGSGSTAAKAHRYSWELVNGPIPDSLVMDHLCRNRACVNPVHVEPVTNHVNVVIRGLTPSALNLRKTHCINGHEFTPENTYIRHYRPGSGRQCAQCTRDRYEKRRPTPLPTLAEQEAAASAALAVRPGMSVRELAQAIGMSERTARRVKARLGGRNAA